MSVSLTNAQKVIITAQALDSAGNQVDFTAAPVFSVGNTALAVLSALDPADPQPEAGQFSMWLTPAAGQTGNDTVSVTELAVLGDETTRITGTIDYTVTQAVSVDLAATIKVTAGTPVAK